MLRRGDGGRKTGSLNGQAELTPRWKKQHESPHSTLHLRHIVFILDKNRSSFVSNLMARKAQDVTDAELAVLQTLWDRGRDTIRRLTDTLYPNGTGVHYATVQKLLERLEAKKYVKRNRNDWPHTFQPLLDRSGLISQRLQMTADKLCEGALAPLLSNLVRASQLNADDRQSLRSLLDELDDSVDKGVKGKR